MEKRYTFLNNVVGWLILLFASYVFIATIEPTASFWDCGEFIASATKLQVGHPPGAPLWMIIARVFGLFATEVDGIAAADNVFSALCSSFSILFLFWSITALSKKMSLQTGKLTTGKILIILSSGIVGATAYTFSDSFWFSAVEAEVYAASSLFTALVFWLILKWEANAHKKYADRYLILVAYFMGLSIGVHILNLLALPALVYVYYFKRFIPTTKGFIAAGVISIIMLGVVQQGIISYTILLATKFELFFVNSIGMPYDSGMWIFFVLIAAAIIFGIIWTKKNNMPNLQNIILGIMVILIGYSSFSMIVIRSAANPPMDENNPENILALLPYLNREQYGDRPLLFGHTFSSANALDADEHYVSGSPVYFRPENQDVDEYKIADKRENYKPNYSKKGSMYFPRMYSSQKHHVRAYKNWSGFEGKKVRKAKVFDRQEGRVKTKNLTIPSFSENMQFFFSYQINFMYWRYFMWNFTGRQNDMQGHGNDRKSDMVLKGNWLSGVPFVDDAHLGNQTTKPDSLKHNEGRNTFYFLPLILGIIGMVFHFSRHKKDAWIVMLLFFMTGIAITIYLNQTPYQPRERDYAYAGSFYAFAIWIGLGVQGLFSFMTGTKKTAEEITIETGKRGIEAKLITLGLYEITTTAFAFLIVGILMFIFNSILKTSGFEVFGLSCIYIGFVIGMITLVCYLLGTITKKETSRAALALIISLAIPGIMGAEGWGDHDRSNRYTATDFAKNYLDSCEKNAIIFTNGDNDTFPLWFVQEVEGYRTDIRVVNLSLLNTDWYIDQMKRKAYESEAVPFSMTQDQYRQGTRDYIYLRKTWAEGYHDINKVMDFVKSDERRTQLPTSSKEYMNFLPTNKFTIPVDKDKVLRNGTVVAEFSDLVPEEMNWTIKGGAVMKAKMMILDLMATNNWERPVYFAITVGSEHYMNLEDYFQLEGLAYKVTPVKHKNTGGTGHINVDKMYNNLVNKFQWGNMEKEGVYLDEQVMRMTMNYQSNFARLARELIAKGDIDRGVKTLDKCMEIMPPHRVPVGYSSLFIADAYYQAGETEKGDTLMNTILDKFIGELKWYISLEEPYANRVSGEVERAFQIISNTNYFSGKNWQNNNAKAGIQIETVNPISEKFREFLNEFAPEIEDYGKRIGQRERYINMLRGK